MQFVTRVALTAIFPIALHIAYLLAADPARAFDQAALFLVAAQWMVAALMLQSLFWRIPLLAAGVLLGAALGAHMGVVRAADAPGAAQALASCVLLYTALGLPLGLGAWISFLTAPPPDAAAPPAA